MKHIFLNTLNSNYNKALINLRAIIVFVSILFLSKNNFSQTTTQNFVKTTQPTAATTSTTVLNIWGASQKIEQINYLDGLGRPSQSVVKQASPKAYDMVQAYEYDVFGRTAKNYLPYADVVADGSYKINPMGSQAAFYTNAYRVAHTNQAYTQNVFENNPLSRITEQASVGTDWQLGNGHTTKMIRRTNTNNEVRQFVISGADNIGSTFYNAKTLYVTQVTGENGELNTQYTDADGHVVLNKTYQNASAFGTAFTYFVYNDLGQLTCVIPPKAYQVMVETNNYTTSALNQDLIYTYKYDNKGRVVEKKVPGKQVEYIVYNKLNQPVLAQDGNLRAQNKWRFVKYDALGRPIMTGLLDAVPYASQTLNYNDRLMAQQLIDLGTVLYEKPSNLNYSTNFGYTSLSAPTQYIDIQTVNYYDDYDFNRDGVADYAFNTTPMPCLQFTSYDVFGNPMYPTCIPTVNTPSTRTRGLMTGSKIKVLDVTNTVQWINSANFYDEFGRTIQSQNNDFTGGSDLFNLNYDFLGRMTYTHLQHTEANATVTTILNSYQYDKMSRLIQVNQKNNNDEPISLAKRTYNELGQIIEKNLHRKDPNNSATSYLQSIDFAYNVRGWLTSINNADLVNDQGLFNAAEMTLDETKKIDSYTIDSLQITFTQVGGTQITAKYDIKKTIKYINTTTQGVTYTTYVSTITQNLIDNTNSLYAATTPVTGAPYKYTYFGVRISGEADAATLYTQISANLSTYLTARGITNTGVKPIIYNNITLTLGSLLNNAITNDDANDAWGEEIKYNTITSGLGGTKQYSGNVAEKHWKSANDDIKRNYVYSYDAANRLINSVFNEFNNSTAQWTANNKFNEAATYDANGNINTLTRTGYLTNSTYGQMDNLTYQYDGNRLKNLVDASTLNGYNDFKDNGSTSTTITEYTYDGNGNMLTDANKGITVTYNHLNLPTKIQYANGNKIEYVYSAVGTRLRKKVTTAPSTVINNYYVGPFQFNDAGLEFIATKEGRIVPTGVVSGARTFAYEYHIKDHTGSAALAVSDLNNNGVFDKSTEIIQVTHYYPFGMQQMGISSPVIGTASKFKLGDKELQDEFGLNQYDFTARFYDPATARFNNLDPLAETSTDWSPFVYCNNNPLSFVDPTGMKAMPIYDQAVSYTDGDGGVRLAGNCMGGTGAGGNLMSGAYSGLTGATGSKNSGSVTYDWLSKQYIDGNGKIISFAQAMAIQGQKGNLTNTEKVTETEDYYYSYNFIPAVDKDAAGAFKATTIVKSRNVEIYQSCSSPWLVASSASGALLADDVPSGGIGAVDDIAIPFIYAAAATYDLKNRTYVTYELTGPGGKKYVGRASGFGTPESVMMGRYAQHHMRALGYVNPKLDESAQGFPAGYYAIRGREQMLIDYYGGIGSPLLGNSINGIWEYNPFRSAYISASCALFGPVIK